jgi:ABC-type phosphate/phosphonate transport system substrate-binding protein
VRRRLTFATYLAPNVRPVYEAVAESVGRALGCAVELVDGGGYERLEGGEEDVAFICGLPYVRLAEDARPTVEPLAAPILDGDRYGGRPIYYSDVIVARDSSATCFADLRGASWAFNEPESQSGYGITRAALASLGETRGFFGRVIQTGFHQRSIRAVASGDAEASAVDSQVLEIELQHYPDLAEQLKVVDELGPSTIQPVVAAARLPATLREELREAILGVAHDAAARGRLDDGLVRRFVAVADADYDDIRAMDSLARDAGLEGFGSLGGCEPSSEEKESG